jgi:hypothetical protein
MEPRVKRRIRFPRTTVEKCPKNAGFGKRRELGWATTAAQPRAGLSAALPHLASKPFIWTAKATDILEKVKRARNGTG